MRRGVGLASMLSGTISTLILFVGAAVPRRPPCVPFELPHLAHVLESVMGPAGRVGFAIGLFGAGLSSALTIPLGTTLALEDLYGWHPSPPGPTPSGASMDAGRVDGKLASLASADGASVPAPAGGASLASLGGVARWFARLEWHRGGRIAFLTVFLGLSLLPSLLYRRSAVAIILTAQVVNGLLLPCVASLLLFSLNDAQLMGAAQVQSMGANAIMFPSVFVTLVLACMTLVKLTVGKAFGAEGGHVAVASAFPLAGMIIVALGFSVRDARRAAPMAPRRPPFAEVVLSQPPCCELASAVA